MPRSTNHSARSTAAAAGPSAAAAHRVGVEVRGPEHPHDRGQRPLDLVDGVEQRLLVLLEVPVVGERADPSSVASIPATCPMSRPALPRASSATSGFFFWGSIELPVA